MATYAELLLQKEALEARIAIVRAEEISGAIARIRALMEQYGLTANDLEAKRERGRPQANAIDNPIVSLRARPPAKYMDPKTGRTWSGRGRAPAWIGTRPDRYLISGF
ncbi:H-NS histone family protein [Cupriavidus sp. UME77]|uniref:H-NS histone family protein n=1 Tax=Cupriavidus sp. UME77 TaxID=1862321 RepID=UPI0015FFCDE2|nr:H-NS histone family protein [Cupriavidus sp. UME77]